MINNVEDLKQWASQGRRVVEISIGGLFDPYEFRIWAYDYDLQVGQAVRELPAEIDIEREAISQIFNEKERLEEKIRTLEGVKNDRRA